MPLFTPLIILKPWCPKTEDLPLVFDDQSQKKRITFSKDLDVKFSGKQIKETEKEITLEGEDEESYLKIYNPFHRVAKLILYEDNTWVDADSMNKIGDLDLSELGLEKLDLK